MSRPPLEVADIIRSAGAAFIERNHQWIGWKHVKVLLAIARCRTAALGGHLDECTRCGHRATISFNSCRNRHCPKCQTAAREQWIAARQKELLPHALYARGLHASPSLGPTGAAEQEGHLRSVVPYQCGNPSRGGTRPETSRRRARLFQCFTHVESAAPYPSACPLRHSRRRSLAGSHPLDSLPREILPPQGSAGRSLSSGKPNCVQG